MELVLISAVVLRHFPAFLILKHALECNENTSLYTDVLSRLQLSSADF